MAESGDILVVVATWGRSAADIQWVEAKVAAKHPAVHRAAPTTENGLALSASDAEAGEACSFGFPCALIGTSLLSSFVFRQSGSWSLLLVASQSLYLHVVDSPNKSFIFEREIQPWLVQLSGLSAGLQTKGSPVQFPVQGMCLGCRPGPQWGAGERQPHIDISLPLSPSLPHSKNK